MKPTIQHDWSLTRDEAECLQGELANRVVRIDQYDQISLIAGVDVAYEKNSNRLYSGVVILDAASLDVVETTTAEDTARFPYFPGLFSFRELPPLIKALEKLQHVPDLIICDGQGIAHPRRFGLACHLGLLFDVPTIGCGKTLLLGDAQKPDVNRGAVAPIFDRGELIGNVLRTQDHVNPVYVSIGHRVSLPTACGWILKLAPRYRLPQPIRIADQTVKCELKRHARA